MGAFGVTEPSLKCQQISSESQKSLEIDCGSPTIGDCLSMDRTHSVPVVHLKAKECPIKLLQNMIEMAPNLTVIDISSSGYEALDTLPFAQQNLETLNVSHNKLTRIPQNFLLHARAVVDLDVSYNRLERIESTAFVGGGVKLRRIDLSTNRIAIIADDAFANLTQLQYVNLNGNQCHWIDMFRNNKHMRTLRIDNNPVYNVDCNHFLKMSSITVEISWNDVRYFHTNCQGSQFNVFLRSNQSESMLPAQREIYCNEQSFKRIQQFSAGRNKFENIGKMLQCFAGSTLKEVDLSGNFVGRINRTVFSRFTNLEWISLSDTILLDFNFDMLTAQTGKLERLDISFNNLMHLNRPEFVQNFRQLRQFIAAECQLRNSHEIISNLPSSMQYLDLSGNVVDRISADLFHRLANLHTLKLNRTGLSWTENTNPFEHCTNLRILDISENLLAGVNFARLSPTLYNLIEFSAANCRLTNAAQIVAHFSLDLMHLDLSGNRLFDQIDAGTFQALVNLKTLTLSNVGLSTFESNSLQAQQHLRFLNISHNHLTQMEFQAMPKSLVKLDIEWNDLTTIWDFDRAHLPALESMSISKNRLQCAQLHALKRNWDGLIFSGDPIDQKDGNCLNDAPNSFIATARVDHESVPLNMQYLLVIVAPISAIMLIGCIGFAIYRQFKTNFKPAEEKMDFVWDVYIENEAHADEHIYEEIEDCCEYDRLRFDTDPLPLKASDNHYHNIHNQTPQNQIEMK